MRKTKNLGFTLDKTALFSLLYRANMTMTDLQDKAGMSNATISSALTNNRAIRPSTANKIAKALGVDVMSILKTDEPQKEGA